MFCFFHRSVNKEIEKPQCRSCVITSRNLKNNKSLRFVESKMWPAVIVLCFVVSECRIKNVTPKNIKRTHFTLDVPAVTLFSLLDLLLCATHTIQT
jgi:hypothetical protein